MGRAGEPAALASLEQLPEPKTARGVRKVCAKLHVARSSHGSDGSEPEPEPGPEA